MTVFLRVLEASVDEKSEALLRAVAGLHDLGKRSETLQRAVFERDPAGFSAVPQSPFAYWVSSTIREAFRRFRRFEADGRTVKHGAATLNDFRFLRLWWECVRPASTTWPVFAKGGAFAPFYADIQIALNWQHDGAEVKAYVASKVGSASRTIQATDYYFRPGLTWPIKNRGNFKPRCLPAGAIFAHVGSCAFVGSDSPTELLALQAIMCSAAFSSLAIVMAGWNFEVGVIQRTPVPTLSEVDTTTLAQLARRAWSLKRSLDTTNETSHAFLLPPGPNEKLTGLDRAAVERELASIQREIDEAAFRLYGIGPEDRAAIEASSKRGTSIADSDGEADEASNADDDLSEDEAPIGAAADTLISWLVGVACGRFDPRLATGERTLPPEPEPFDPLPSRSPGMYPEGEEPAERPDILVDDEGHADDLAARAVAIAERVKVDVPENLRAWLAREFFPLHIKMYSKSRRKAPIYWQLATPSAGYSVWLYLHAFSKDTLFRVQNDYAAPKLTHEERRLESLTSELRDGATAAQRKELATQETFVEELRAFLEEVKRVAPLWNPNLDDGVIINFAPLWRLVPQNKAWQKELRSTWDALGDGKYDWAHLAMHLWPERVVPKCAKDRSLAIAHGLEDVFWAEGTDGKWTARKTPTRSVDDLVRERTSPAVKSALKSLLEAPAATGNGGRGRGGRRRATATAEGGEA